MNWKALAKTIGVMLVLAAFVSIYIYSPTAGIVVFLIIGLVCVSIQLYGVFRDGSRL